MMIMRVIEHPISSYATPLLPVLKKDGSLRLCFDFRKLNQATLAQQERMPNPEDMFSKLAKAKTFTKMDLTREYGK